MQSFLQALCIVLAQSVRGSRLSATYLTNWSFETGRWEWAINFIFIRSSTIIYWVTYSCFNSPFLKISESDRTHLDYISLAIYIWVPYYSRCRTPMASVSCACWGLGNYGSSTYHEFYAHPVQQYLPVSHLLTGTATLGYYNCWW